MSIVNFFTPNESIQKTNTKINYSEEQQNIIDSSGNCIILGGPGVGKTHTLIGKVIHELTINNQNVLILTRIGSVVEEIVQRTSMELNQPILQVGNSNHYSYTNEITGKTLGIASYDAFIDYQLRINKIGFDGNDFQEKNIKFKKLCTTVPDIYIKNNKKLEVKVDILLLDEAQDLTHDDINNLIQILKKNKYLKIILFGDILQTLFNQSTKKGYDSPIWEFYKQCNKIEVSCSILQLRTCFRCPEGHINFYNQICIENIWFDKYKLEKMKYGRKDNTICHKPILFTHGGISTSKQESRKAAKKTFDLIKYLIKNVEDISIGECFIYCPRINDNDTLKNLNNIINEEWEDKCCLFETKGEKGNNIKIDWSKAKDEKCTKCNRKYPKKGEKCTKCSGCGNTRKFNKIILSSIHAVKGLEQKCCIMLGCTTGGLDKESHGGKDIELIDQSLLAVAITRSSKYLFIGMSDKKPSNYLKERINDDTCNYSYNSWINLKSWERKFKENNMSLYKKYENLFNKPHNNIITIPKTAKKIEIEFLNWWNNNINLPEHYKELLTICNKDQTPPTIYDFKKNNTPEKTTIKDIMCITSLSITDIANEIEIENNTIDEIFGEGKECLFAKKISYNPPIESYKKYEGFLVEFMIDFYYKKLNRNIFKPPIQYVNDNDDIVIFKDLNVNTKMLKLASKKDMDLQSILHEGFINKIIFNEELSLKYNINHICLLAHIKFRQFEDERLQCIKAYEEGDFKKIPLSVFWNTMLFYKSIISEDMNFEENLLGHYNDNDNTEIYNNIIDISKYISDFKKYNFQKSYSVNCIIEEEKILEKLLLKKNIKTYKLSINGRVDAEFDDTLIEFKYSNIEDCDKTWKLQCLLYTICKYLQTGKFYSNICIINIKKGTIYNFNNLNINDSEIYNLFEKILLHYKFIPELKDKCLSKLLHKNWSPSSSNSLSLNE
jgi:hypothetical protein